MKKYLFLLLAMSIVLNSCIKDDIIQDFVDPTIRITTIPDTIVINSTYQFEFIYLNNIGLKQEVDAIWSSSNPSIIGIDANGLATAKAIGNADISIEYKSPELDLKEVVNVSVGLTSIESSIEKTGSIESTSSYTLEGDFKLIENDNNLSLAFSENYKASTALPGLYIYLSNNPNSIANAFEISPVETFAGVHNYTIENVKINDYKFLVYFCKPFNVKVGDGEIN